MPNLLKLKRGTAATIPVGSAAEPLFTTDTYDLYIGKGNGSNQRFQKYIASGTSSQFLKGDGSLDSTSYQTALTFSSPLVNTSGTISIPAATGSVNGYLTSTDWTTFNSKEPAITVGTSLQYYRGDKTFQTLNTSVVPESGAIYFTEPRVLATVLTGLNLSGGGTIAATDSVLTAFGKIQNQISGIAGGVSYQTTWNASTNTPTLTSSVGTKGYYYVVSVAGSTNLNGITDWKVGDWAIFNGTAWDKVDNTDAVSSVNGFTGAVNLGLGDISNVTLTSPTNGQILQFNGTSSKWVNWTPTYISGNQTITLSGDVSGSGTTAITTTIGALKVTNAMLAGTIDYAKMDATTVPTWNQNTTGSAATLTTARNFTINGTAKSFNGSANVSWTAAEIGLTSYLPLVGGTMSGDIEMATNKLYFGSGLTYLMYDTSFLRISGDVVLDNKLSIKGSAASNKIVLDTDGSLNGRVRIYDGATTSLKITLDGATGGATLTGALIGTSATFSGNVIASQIGVGGQTPRTSSTLKTIESTNYVIEDNGDFGWKSNAYFNGTNNIYINTAAATRMYAGAGEIIFYTAPSGTAGNAVTFTPRLTIANTGAATFSSSVTSTIYTSTSGQIEIQGSANALKTLYINRYGVATGSQHRIRSENAYFEIASANSEPIVLTGGNVGIGTTLPSSLFHVYGVAALNWAVGQDNTGLVTIGQRNNASPAGSLMIQLPTHNVYYPAGLGFDGSHDSVNNITTAKIHAYGVKYSGWYGDLAFYTSSGTSEYERMRITSGGATQIKGTLQTYAPGSTSVLGDTWKLGGFTNTSVSPATGYLYVQVNGASYYIGLVNPL